MSPPVLIARKASRGQSIPEVKQAAVAPDGFAPSSHKRSQRAWKIVPKRWHSSAVESRRHLCGVAMTEIRIQTNDFVRVLSGTRLSNLQMERSSPKSAPIVPKFLASVSAAVFLNCSLRAARGET
jgi:hypothetical protein